MKRREFLATAAGFAVASKAIGQGGVVGASEDAESVALRNGAVELTLGKARKGAIVSLVDLRTGLELVDKAGADWLFALAVSMREGDGADRRYVSSASAAEVTYEVEEGAGSAGVIVRYAGLEDTGIACACTVSVAEGDPLVRFRLAADVPEPRALEEVSLPGLALRAPLTGSGQDRAVLGHTKGGVYRAPAEWDADTWVSAEQPGTLAAQFACYYGPEVGVYTAAYDAAGYPKRASLGRTGSGVRVVWTERCFVTGAYAQDYDIVLGAFAAPEGETETDWRDAADVYKAWAERQHWCRRTYAERDDLPEWLREGAPMVRFHRGWLAEPESIEQWFTNYWKRCFPTDLPLIAAYWGWEKVESWVTPDYFPVFPSDEAFRSLTGAQRAMGAHVFPWPSGYHYTLTFEDQGDGRFRWDDRERFDATARPHAVHNRDGSLYTMKGSWLRGGENACLCPGDPWTRAWFDDIGQALTARGADMVQVDQVVGGRFPACYRTDHGHPPGPGLWMTEVFREQLRSLLARCRSLDPEAVVCFEEPNEHFIQEAAIQDYRDWEALGQSPPREPASVFGYLYHEYLPVFQSNPRTNDLYLQAYCLVNGQIPHFTPSRETGAGPLLANGDFEEWVGDAPAGWDRVAGWQDEVWRGECARDAEVRHGGGSSLRLRNQAEDDVVQVSRNLMIGETFHAGGAYRLSAWLRSEGLARPNAINLATLTGDLRSTGSWRIPMPEAGGEWSLGEATFTVPAEGEFLRIMLHVSGPGTVWVDDLVLEEVLDDGSTRIVDRPEFPPDHAMMSQWVRLFSGEGRPYLLLGRMLRPPVLTASATEYGGRAHPAILHNAYRAPDGSEAVVLVNATHERQLGRLEWHGRSVALDLAPWEARLVRD